MGGSDTSRSSIEILFDELMHPLRHVLCPVCSVRFGMEADEVAFAEQVTQMVWCPRGHRMNLHTRHTSD